MDDIKIEIRDNILFTKEELEKLWEDEKGWVTAIPGETSFTSRFIYKRINGVLHFKDLSAAYQEKKKKLAKNSAFEYEPRPELDNDNDRTRESEAERLREESLREAEREEQRRRDYDDWLDYNYAAMEIENQRYEDERRQQEWEEQNRINQERFNEWFS